ncbi:MAG: acyltransferase [Desulfobacterales bacterium]|nr:acyltransferase [Desulfobacterales bacterium]MCP4163559.1 acyltransferase [Deltaproteobacteria bacterium]
MNFIKKIHKKYFIKSGFEYAAYLKKKMILKKQGENCFISKGADISDPYLTSIGDNVWITDGCKLLCHDASVIMLNMRDGSHFDKVNIISIGNNSFLGNNTIVLPGVSIGNSTIIGAGSVINKNIGNNSIWAGNPAKFICTLDEYIEKTEQINKSYPWKEILTKRSHKFDPKHNISIEKKLRTERDRYFYK